MSLDVKEFAANVRAERARCSLTQQQLADALGVSTVTVSNYENGDSLPQLETFYKMCRVFNCDPNTLYSWDRVEEVS